MSRVMIICPATEKPVYTHLSFTWNTFDSAYIGEQSMHCTKCGEVHVWRREDAFLEEDGRGD